MMHWIHETPPYWDANKARIVGEAGQGIFAPTLTQQRTGTLLPNDWWRVELDGRCVGYGWMDVTWGDAEILLSVANDARGLGVGTFILERLDHEARERGLCYLYNMVRQSHPHAAEISAWLKKRRFTASDDGKLLRAVVQTVRRTG